MSKLSEKYDEEVLERLRVVEHRSINNEQRSQTNKEELARAVKDAGDIQASVWEVKKAVGNVQAQIEGDSDLTQQAAEIDYKQLCSEVVEIKGRLGECELAAKMKEARPHEMKNIRQRLEKIEGVLCREDSLSVNEKALVMMYRYLVDNQDDDKELCLRVDNRGYMELGFG